MSKNFADSYSDLEHVSVRPRWTFHGTRDGPRIHCSLVPARWILHAGSLAHQIRGFSHCRDNTALAVFQPDEH
jgi:hypothetical protein